MKTSRPYGFLLILMSMLFCANVQASVTLSGTRVIFAGSEKEVTVQLANDGKLPALVQAWIDKGDERATPDTIDVPFVITPTIFRIEPGKGQTLRLIYSGEPLPADKESLFWLNVLDVPPKAAPSDDVNRLQFAFRTRVKLMYRPDGLPGSALDAPGKLKWALATDNEQRPVLKATNETAYVVNLSGIALKSGGKTFEVELGYVRPGETATFPIKGADRAALTGGTVLYSSVDDWGSNHGHEAQVSK
ncbi:fimbrial biogenesis chaperone [Burkholderia ambifaria]|uniref:fimbrial biogenesis chaperone n=1 Tax=Burkholderia ambifaria TaxID=152480 RepID=UPI00158B507A|nr:fimbria/pilus periplasmic chaperone [Burkholderia ambifaria]UEP23698.1 fimbria/pilus periplasmic chaperone [Burkholderia ambifaria]WAS56799.1 fimbria/pilus periplasmic chaperone [Burkholderia ambifaria]WDR88022.1 fimbria/pilus periplasmic chaperone [Burkholderia ambifaria]WDS00751.1 fimbria/pilus periplasmic chaperone [Burkholderia ambifaria]